MKWFSCTVTYATLSFSGVAFASQPQAASEIEFNIIQINDVYEMFPLNDGLGGLAKISGLKQELVKENPKTFVFMAGDFLNPSSLTSAQDGDIPFHGKHMTAVANHFVDYVTFGNHEFDIPEQALKENIRKSKFRWVASNVFEANGEPYADVLENDILRLKKDDVEVSVGVFTVTLDSNKPAWVTYDNDYIKVAKDQVQKLKDKGADVIVAMTHLRYIDDERLAIEVPEIDIIMGGHEHENINTHRGPNFTPIFKADANARTAYIHKFNYQPQTKKLKIQSTLRVIDDSIVATPGALTTAQHWDKIAKENFLKQKINIEAEFGKAPFDLDGRESIIRNQSNDLTNLIADGILKLSGADVAFFNAGAVRIDDLIGKGDLVRGKDILRLVPFYSPIILAEMKGNMLIRILNSRDKSKNRGGFLHHSKNIMQKEGVWYIKDEPIMADYLYKIASNEYVLYQSSTLKFLREEENTFTVISKDIGDIRQGIQNEFSEFK